MPYPSAIVIIIINAIPLYLAAAGRWGPFDVLAAYWWVGFWFALASVAKVIIVRQLATQAVREEFDILDIPNGVYIPAVLVASSLSLWGFWSMADSGTSFFSWPNGGLIGHIISGLFAHGVIWFALVAAIRVVYSLATNFVQHREYQRARMILEHGLVRIVMIEVMAGLLVGASLSTNWWPLWLAAMGIGVTDIIFHLMERVQGSQLNHPSTVDYGRGG